MNNANGIERVIFRREYNPYKKTWDYLAVFPDYTNRDGTVDCLPFYIDGRGVAWFECWCSADISYLHSNRTKIVHKNDEEIPHLVSLLKDMYGGEYKVCERITTRRT